MFIKKTEQVLTRTGEPKREDLELQVEFAVKNSKEGAQTLIADERRKASRLEGSIL
jgi:hypothetical protein